MSLPEEVEVTILMPCLNEADTLKTCLHEAFSALEMSGVVGEVVVSDNGSTDGSAEIAARAGARVVHAPQRGYGSALRQGIEAARGKYVLMGDADGSYDFRELPRFLQRLRDGDDMVMGCRFPRLGGRIDPGAMPWKHRWIGNPILSAVGRLFFAAPVSDFHCGLRAFRRDAILNLDLRTSGMEFASEMVVKASLEGLRIGQVPITLRRDGRSRTSHLRSWRDGWRHLRFMLFYAPGWLFIFPGLVLTLAGACGFALLWPEPLTLGRITLDLNSLLVSGTGILVGFQVLTFGLFVKAYAVSIGLLPGKGYWLKMIEGRSAEWGMIVGLLLILMGFGVFAGGLMDWRAANFGPLPYQQSLRSTILALTLIGLGIQVMVSGFALNMLGLKR
jgi:glycosyltransferase involved in cell wall biosynthesis